MSIAGSAFAWERGRIGAASRMFGCREAVGGGNRRGCQELRVVLICCSNYRKYFMDTSCKSLAITRAAIGGESISICVQMVIAHGGKLAGVAKLQCVGCDRIGLPSARIPDKVITAIASQNHIGSDASRATGVAAAIRAADNSYGLKSVQKGRWEWRDCDGG